MPFKVSVIIQTHNDDQGLEDLFCALAAQKNVEAPEVIVADHGSVDNTVDIALEHGVRVLRVGDDDPRRSMGLNSGAEAAKGETLIFTTGRSLPLRDDWLSNGIRHFSQPLVGGVFAPVLPHASSSLADHLYCWPFYVLSRMRNAHRVDSGSLAKFATANIALRRSDWRRHPFTVGLGPERQMEEWIAWMIGQGYDFFEDFRFSVRYPFELDMDNLKDRWLGHIQSTYGSHPKTTASATRSNGGRNIAP